MKTKDFIKMLQEADPNGEAHIRMDGGIPTSAHLIPGYYDGYYQYFDNNGNYVYSIAGNKVDIYSSDIEGFIESTAKMYPENNWEEIKSSIKFEFGDYANTDQKTERENKILNEAKESYDEYQKMQKQFFENDEKESVKLANKGWTFFQNKKVDDTTLKPNMHHFYTWKIYNRRGRLNDTGSNIAETHGISKSEKFKRLDNGKKKGYYQWVLK